MKLSHKEVIEVKFLQFLLALVGLILLGLTAACGGDGGDGGQTGPNPDGVYTMAYNRAGGSVQINIHSRNQLNVLVWDGADYYNGNGSINSQFHFNVTCSTNSVPAKNVTVTGDISQVQGNTFQIAVSISGSFSASGTATFQVPSAAQAFAGDYSGTCNNGTFSGTMSLHVASDGNMHLRLVLNGQQYDSYAMMDGFYQTLSWQIPPGHGMAQVQFLLAPNNMKLLSGHWFLTNYDGHSNNAEGLFSAQASG